MTAAQVVGSRNLVEKIRKQRHELKKQFDNETFLENIGSPGIDEVYDLALFYDPLDYQSQKALAVMNYYKIAFKRVKLAI